MTDLSTSNSLTDLAARIRAEHEASVLAVKRGLEHAISAGRMLIEAKQQLAHGEWLPWLYEYLPEIAERAAQLYMRLSRHAPELHAKSASLADLTIAGAAQLLASPSAAGDVGENSSASCLDDVNPLDLSIGQIVLLKLWRIDTRIRLFRTGMHLPDDLTFEQWKAAETVLRELPDPWREAQ